MWRVPARTSQRKCRPEGRSLAHPKAISTKFSNNHEHLIFMTTLSKSPSMPLPYASRAVSPAAAPHPAIPVPPPGRGTASPLPAGPKPEAAAEAVAAGAAEAGVAAVEERIRRQIRELPRLASLRSINKALGELLNSENNFTFQIAEIVRRDPSLTARMLRMVNSVFFGFSRRITSIEEAVFYLGMRQIRELAMVTPVIEEMEKLSGRFLEGRWQQLWLHSIGTAMLTREIAAPLRLAEQEENDYIAGLVHHIGKITMALLFPEVLEKVTFTHAENSRQIVQMEREWMGVDHAWIGGIFLQHHQLSEDIVEGVTFHHAPGLAPRYGKLAAAVQVADYLVRAAGIPGIEPLPVVAPEGVRELEGWRLLFGQAEDEDLRYAALAHSAARLPVMLRGVV